LLAPPPSTVAATVSAERLDRLIWYLRRVHLFCYYCGEQFDDEDEMYRRCGSIHLRGSKKEGAAKEAFAITWAASLDTKLANRLAVSAQETLDVLIGKRLAQRMWEFNIVKVADDKFQCKLCAKMFVGPEFVRKHLVLKHADKQAETDSKAREEQYFLNYINDPKRPTPQPVLPVRMPMMPLPPLGILPFPSPAMNRELREEREERAHWQQRDRRPRRDIPPRRDRRDLDTLPPPPGHSADPRAGSVRSYVDLDAPPM